MTVSCFFAVSISILSSVVIFVLPRAAERVFSGSVRYSTFRSFWVEKGWLGNNFHS